jgi:hypothetical protein
MPLGVVQVVKRGQFLQGLLESLAECPNHFSLVLVQCFPILKFPHQVEATLQGLSSTFALFVLLR